MLVWLKILVYIGAVCIGYLIGTLHKDKERRDGYEAGYTCGYEDGKRNDGYYYKKLMEYMSQGGSGKH